MSVQKFAFLLCAACVAGPPAGGPSAAGGEPLTVFVLAGQSNMQGHAQLRTFDAMALDPATAPLLAEMRNDDGSPVVLDDVWISSLGSASEVKTGKLTAGYGAGDQGEKIGPEFTFGLEMRKAVDGPILIIKTAWGGKSLNTDFRPPSAGPYQFNESQLENFRKREQDVAAETANKAEATGKYYRLMTEHVKSVLADPGAVVPDYDPEAGYTLGGFVWFQGWNDMVDGGTYPNRGEPGGYDLYSELMTTFIKDVRKDLDAPDLPFVIGVLGVGGPVELYGEDQRRYRDTHANFRAAMAAPAARPEFAGNVAAVKTEIYWDQDVVALRKKEAPIRKEGDRLNAAVKAGELTREQREERLAALDRETFTPQELTILRESVSNGDYHYMGSAKVMAQIGRGFAEALTELRRPAD